ncbi:MAG: hypothetical protein ACI4PP_08535 [Clostridia bacterium]
MNSVLNGTGWGEMPEKELEIPWFMYAVREDKRLADEREAETEAAVGRERRRLRAKRRAEEKRKKNLRLGVAVVPALALFLAVTAYVAEVMIS